MNKETREEIVAKIEAKKNAIEKKLSKPKNKLSQREMYSEAIVEHQKKIAKLEALIAKIDDSTVEINAEISLRETEVEHMEEILSRFDRAMKERDKLSEAMLSRVEVLSSTWTPGGKSITDKVAEDSEYQKALIRKNYLEKMLPECLTDIGRIFYSRGDVSDYNIKGRKGV